MVPEWKITVQPGLMLGHLKTSGAVNFVCRHVTTEKSDLSIRRIPTIIVMKARDYARFSILLGQEWFIPGLARGFRLTGQSGVYDKEV